MNDFAALGFNEDESGRKVFDGMMQWIAAGDGINMNHRWSQTKRTNRNRQDLLYLEGKFPFANIETTDPLTATRTAVTRGAKRPTRVRSRLRSIRRTSIG